MSKLSLKELESAVASYVAGDKIATTFEATRNNIVGLLDKIGKIITLDSPFYDKLPELDGDELPYGKTVEEYFQDLIMAIDWNQDTDGSRALKFYSPTYRPVSYSFSFGKKVIPTSIPNNNIERAVNNADQFVLIITLMTKRLTDSANVYKYQIKRELLGKLADKVADAYDDATSYVDATTDVSEGTFYKQSTAVAVCVKSHTHAVGDDWDSLIDDGILIPLQMKKVVAIPTDTESGEAFVVAVKEAVEKAQDISEGFSLNGNTIGAETGLSMYVKQGVLPNLEVNTLAGAFHLEKMGMGVSAKTIKDFGSTTSKVYAMIIDSRGVKLHKDYEAVRENMNGAGDFLNLFHHLEFTGFISRNTFITIFVEE